jgi:hypothetical protein
LFTQPQPQIQLSTDPSTLTLKKQFIFEPNPDISSLLSTISERNSDKMNVNSMTIVPPDYWKTLLAFTPIVGSAIYFCWARLYRTGAFSQLLSGSSDIQIRIGSQFLDKLINFNINFYQAALDTSNPPVLLGAVSSTAACAFFPLVESLRISAPKQIQYPLITGLAAQTMGHGVIYPL